MSLNDTGKRLVARMARRAAADRKSQLTTLDAVERSTHDAFIEACNGDQAMSDLRHSEAAESYFATVFFDEFAALR